MKIPLFLCSLLVPGTVFAGDSIITITTNRIGGGAVTEIRCTACKPKDAVNTADHHGVEISQTRIGDETKTVQIDNMMGGSPVRIVRTAYSTPDERTGEGVEVFDPEPDGKRRSVGGTGGAAPVAAGAIAQVTFSGGGDFDVGTVSPDKRGEQLVDPGSQTSSVDMQGAEHDTVEEPAITNPAPSHGNPEILELRPGSTVGPRDQ